MNNRLRGRFVPFALLAAFLLSFAAAPALAQAAPAKVLGPADVSAYVSNFNAIQDEMDALGDKYDDYFPDAFDVEDENADLSASFRRLRSLKPPAEIAAILKKNGLGNNGFEKFVVISYCIGIAAMESSFDLYAAQYADNEQMMEYFEESKKNLEAMKGAVNPADLKLVASRLDELAPLMEIETGEY